MLLLVGAVRYLTIYHVAILVLDNLISSVAGTNHCAPSFKFRLKILAITTRIMDGVSLQIGMHFCWPLFATRKLPVFPND